jgi:hypothetical protein
MMNNSRSQREELNANGIRKIVWKSPYVQTDTGHMVRGVVGRTQDGEYKAGRGLRHDQAWYKDGLKYSSETLSWGDKAHPHKEHAIHEARKWVAETVGMYRQGEKPAVEHSKPDKSVAAKYGGNDTQNRSITPPSRSR